jgi:hypothetical protein
MMDVAYKFTHIFYGAEVELPSSVDAFKCNAFHRLHLVDVANLPASHGNPAK